MEWFWEILGINATTQVAEIKKAYVNEVRRLKNKETKENVPQADYDKLAEAENAALAFIEEQHNQQPPIGHRPSYREQQASLLKSEQEVVSPIEVPETVKEEPLPPEVNKAIVKAEPEKKEAKQVTPKENKVASQVPEKKKATSKAKSIIGSQERWTEAKETVKKRNQGRQQKMTTEPKKEPEPPKTIATKVAVAKESPHEEVKETKSEAVSQVVRPVTEKAAVPSRMLADSRELLADWPRKVILKEWKTCFRYRRQWSNEEFLEIRENFLPLLKEQLAYLPKPILWYLYEELDLATYELTTEFNWFMAIDDLPDFSFNQALYLPEEEAADYFDRRLHLYHVIGQDDWHSRTFEIDGLLAYFYSQEGWQADHQILDQDVENLAAIYRIKQGLEKLVHNNEPNREIAKHLLPPNTPLNQIENQTAKFLRIIFTSLKVKTISLEESLFIENPQTTYLEDNLRELLVGLVFYRTNDRAKATKHFNNLTNDYQGLAKGLQNSIGFKGLEANPVNVGPTTKKKDFDWRMILRVVVIGAIGLSLLGDVFSNDDAYDYSDDSEYFDEESEANDDWVNPQDPGSGFLTYFVEETAQRDDIYSQRERFIETWVSPDLTDVFEEHLADSDSEETYNYDMIYKEIDDNTSYYLITKDDEPYLIVEVTNWDTVTAVVGQGWQEVDTKTFDEWVNKMKRTTKELVENVVVGYFLLPANEREDAFYYVVDYITDAAYDRLEWDMSIVEDLDFEKGTYQLSETRDGKQALVVNDSQDELSLVLILDSFGRVNEVIEVSYDDYPAADLMYLKEKADKKQSLPKPDAVSL